MIENAVRERGREGTRFGSFWLIVRYVDDQREVLTLGTEGEEVTLPVFSFREEALLFLCLSGLGGGWHVRENATSDLLVFLADTDAGRVALDPFPETGLRCLHGLVSLPREEFVELLTGELPAVGRRSLARRGA